MRLSFRDLSPVLLLTSVWACNCDNPEPEAPVLHSIKEVFSINEINISRREFHRYAPLYSDTRLSVSRTATEAVTLENRLDLIIVLDKSESMRQENQDFLHGSARAFLDELSGGDVAQADLRVRFLGAGPSGFEGNIDFDDRMLRNDIRDNFTEDMMGNRTYRYPRVRALMRQASGLADDDALQTLLTDIETELSHAEFDNWNDNVRPTVLGSDAFNQNQGAESLPEWFELYVRHAIASRGDQGFLWSSLLRYLERRPDGRGFPRRDSLLAVVLITDDQEDQVLDLEDTTRHVRWPMYGEEDCPGGMSADQYDMVQPCKVDKYVQESLQFAREAADNTQIRVFAMSCSNVFSPDNTNCALRAQDVAAGSRFRPPYERLTTATGGAHATLPNAGDIDSDRMAFADSLRTFGERILFSTRRRINLRGLPGADSLKLSYQGTDIPRVEPGAETPKGFICIDPKGKGLCQELEIVGYTVEELPVGATVDAEFVPFGSRAPGDPDTLSLSKRPAQGSLQVTLNGIRLGSPDDFTYDEASNTVQFPSPRDGVLRADYLIDPAETEDSFLVILSSLPLAAPIQVWIQGRPFPECPEGAEDADKTLCFDYRQWRAIEIWRGDLNGERYPREGAQIEVLYSRIERFADPFKRASGELVLSRTPESADLVTVWTADTMPEILAPEQEGEPRAERYSGFTPLDPGAWTLEGNEVRLGTPPAPGSAVLVTYEPSVPLANRAATRALDTTMLSAIRDLRVYKESCLGDNGAMPGETVMDGIDRVVGEQTASMTIGMQISTVDGPSRQVSGIDEHPDFVVADGYYADSCSDQQKVDATVMYSIAEAFALEGDYVHAFCFAVRSAQTCEFVGQEPMIGYLTNELARHNDTIFSAPSDDRKLALLDVSESIFFPAIGASPGLGGPRVNLAFALLQRAELEPNRAAQLRNTALQLLRQAATITNNAIFWDLLAYYLDVVYNDDPGFREAARRAAALDPDVLSTRYRPPLSAMARGNGCGEDMQKPTCGDQGGGCDNGGGDCDKVSCRLTITFYVGVHPAVQIGRNVQNATEFAICELLTGGCDAACRSGGGTSAACLSGNPDNSGLAGADSILSGLLGGGKFNGSIGFSNDGSVRYDATYAHAPNKAKDGVSVSFGLGVRSPGPRERGGAGGWPTEVTRAGLGGAAFTGSNGQPNSFGTSIGGGFNFDPQTCEGKGSFSGGVSPSGGYSHRVSTNPLNGPSPDQAASACGQ